MNQPHVVSASPVVSFFLPEQAPERKRLTGAGAYMHYRHNRGYDAQTADRLALRYIAIFGYAMPEWGWQHRGKQTPNTERRALITALYSY